MKMFQTQGMNLPGTKAKMPLVEGEISWIKYPRTTTPAIAFESFVKSVKNFILMSCAITSVAVSWLSQYLQFVIVYTSPRHDYDLVGIGEQNLCLSCNEEERFALCGSEAFLPASR